MNPFRLDAAASMLFVDLAPDVAARVLDRAGVVRVRRELMIDVIMSQRDVVPLVGLSSASFEIRRRRARDAGRSVSTTSSSRP